MKRRHQTPAHVISLSGIADLRRIDGDPQSGMTLGAMVTLREIERHPVLREAYPAVAHAAATLPTGSVMEIKRSWPS